MKITDEELHIVRRYPKCECGSEMIIEPGFFSTPVDSLPLKGYTYQCEKCGKTELLLDIYPHILLVDQNNTVYRKF